MVANAKLSWDWLERLPHYRAHRRDEGLIATMRARRFFTVFSLTALLALAAAGSGCERDQYKIAGCERTHPLAATAPSSPVWRPEHSVVCVISDRAERIPTCPAVSVVYKRLNNPHENYGVVVTRATSRRAECQGMYTAGGVHMGDLPNVE